jgi:hypothetical protein
MVYNVVVGSIVGNAPVSQLKGMFGGLDSGVSIATVARGTPVGEWTSAVEGYSQFVVATVTDKVLERAGCIVVALGSHLTLKNRVCSLKVVSVTTEVDINLVLVQDRFYTM